MPPHLAVSKLVKYIKDETSIKLQHEFKLLQKDFWGRHLWARGYFVAGNGNVTNEIIIRYIKDQELEKEDWTEINDFSEHA